jgi:hypothetical protein
MVAKMVYGATGRCVFVVWCFRWRVDYYAMTCTNNFRQMENGMYMRMALLRHMLLGSQEE